MKRLRAWVADWIGRRLVDLLDLPPRCDHPGCLRAGRKFEYPCAGTDDRALRYCREHCGGAGFCWDCLGFCLGIDEDIEEIGVCGDCRRRKLEESRVETDGPPWKD
jgi:hypothetical protein